MLVLSRKPGESITLDTGKELIRVVHLETYDSGRIKIGFEAPKSVTILRDELTTLEDFTNEKIID